MMHSSIVFAPESSSNTAIEQLRLRRNHTHAGLNLSSISCCQRQSPQTYRVSMHGAGVTPTALLAKPLHHAVLQHLRLLQVKLAHLPVRTNQVQVEHSDREPWGMQLSTTAVLMLTAEAHDGVCLPLSLE